MLAKNLPRLVASLIICQLAGIIGSFFTVPAITSWYATLVKPSFNPPNYLFGPVWFTLYILMGISLYLVWQKKAQKKTREALILFGFHLLLNAAWSILFFGLKNLALAFGEIIILWLFILIVIYKFWKIEPKAGMLLLPYFLWVSFASILSYSIWFLNP